MTLPTEHQKAVQAGIQEQVAGTLRRLLEKRHLYQSLEVELDAKTALLAKKVKRTPLDDELLLYAQKLLKEQWYVIDRSGASYSFSESGCNFRPSDIKTFCTKCDRLEPFTLLRAADYFMPVPSAYADPFTYTVPAGSVQNFVLSYLCQSCKDVPEVFLVRRVGSKLTLCGRSPIEHVDVPRRIPDGIKKYVSGAIVAHQSAQTLAGLFLLRTAIEQWLRSLGATGRADDVLAWYMSTLPDDFKSWAPSLEHVYGYLSDAIHRADASEATFDKAIDDIDRHFEGRHLQRLQEPRS